MLQSLSVKNYALISRLEIGFAKGLSVITGETGAGKSILVGALGLLLGKRADTGVLKDRDQKCMVEAGFNLDGLGLEPFFQQHDLDYDSNTLIRREVTSQGKSRAFINDTPVVLATLRELAENLVDIHSQHQNLILNHEDYPLQVIDRYGHLEKEVAQYELTYHHYQEIRREMNDLKDRLAKAREDQDYYRFQLTQLEQARLQEGEVEDLESQQELLSHAEEIHSRLAESVSRLLDQEPAVVPELKQIIRQLTPVSQYASDLSELLNRLESSYIELEDLSRGLENLVQTIEVDPLQLNRVNERLDLINSLLQKHQAKEVSELFQLQQQYRKHLDEIETSDETMNSLSEELKKQSEKLNQMAEVLSVHRTKVIPRFEKQVMELLRELGMPHGMFQVAHSREDNYQVNGIDRLQFLFAANKNQQPEELSKVASGGEISRLMLAIKSLISDSLNTPTLIFDEIDAGVSGEIAFRMGSLIKQVATGRQVINITHLPQVAAKGDHHYVVYKYDDDTTTHTSVKQLSAEERITEIARLLSGETITEEALNNAKTLLLNP
ncbi:MAG: DNA repair protein RecN [Bacteroidales bacterium]|nr:DNA repair protein RecN [Bacteroidales bacterium]